MTSPPDQADLPVCGAHAHLAGDQTDVDVLETLALCPCCQDLLSKSLSIDPILIRHGGPRGTALALAGLDEVSAEYADVRPVAGRRPAAERRRRDVADAGPNEGLRPPSLAGRDSAAGMTGSQAPHGYRRWPVALALVGLVLAGFASYGMYAGWVPDSTMERGARVVVTTTPPSAPNASPVAPGAGNPTAGLQAGADSPAPPPSPSAVSYRVPPSSGPIAHPQKQARQENLDTLGDVARHAPDTSDIKLTVETPTVAGERPSDVAPSSMNTSDGIADAMEAVPSCSAGLRAGSPPVPRTPHGIEIALTALHEGKVVHDGGVSVGDVVELQVKGLTCRAAVIICARTPVGVEVVYQGMVQATGDVPLREGWPLRSSGTHEFGVLMDEQKQCADAEWQIILDVR